jgi:hypothetical protein
MLAEMFLQTALGAMLQFDMPGKSRYRTSSAQKQLFVGIQNWEFLMSGISRLRFRWT